MVVFGLGCEGKWVRLVFSVLGRQKGGGGLGGEAGALDGRERHAGSSVAQGKGVVGGRAFVFNGKWGNVEVTGAMAWADPASFTCLRAGCRYSPGLLRLLLPCRLGRLRTANICRIGKALPPIDGRA